MESNAAAAVDRPDSLTIHRNFHRIYDYCCKNPTKQVSATLELSRLYDVAKGRIRDFYLKGVISPGVGMDLIMLLQPAGQPLSYMFVDSRTRRIPNVGSKLRPFSISLFNDFSARMIKALKDYNIADIARWNIMSDGKAAVSSLVLKGVEDRYTKDGAKILYLTGYQMKADLVKHFMPIIIEGERKERGEELYARFQALRYIELQS